MVILSELEFMSEENALQTSVPREKPVKTEIQEKKVSLLQKVTEGLKTDKRVYVAGVILHPNYGVGFLEAVDVIVAPVSPIYDAEKLNEFMDSLVPEIPRSARDAASKHSEEENFALGRLYFDETLGTTKKEIKITTTTVDPEALKRAGVPIGESYKTEEELLRRRIWVRVYPDANSAQIIAEYEQGRKNGTVEQNPTFDFLEHWFSAKQFKELKRLSGKQVRPKLLKDGIR